MTDSAKRTRTAPALSDRRTADPSPRRRPGRRTTAVPTVEAATAAPAGRAAGAADRAGDPTGKRRTGRPNYPVQKKFLLDSARHGWLVGAAHRSGPAVGYVAVLRAAIDLLAADPALLAALRAHLAGHGPSGQDRARTITLNLTHPQSQWLRSAAHHTGDEGISQHQLVHGIIDWLTDTPDALAAVRAALPNHQ